MTAHGRSAWLLNLDAEYELASPDAHTPSARMLERMPELVRALAPLFGPDDVVLADGSTVDRSYAGRAWCPTPRALARLTKAGAAPVRAPALEVLRRVNHRRFCAELGQRLPGARFVTTLAELTEVVRGDSPSGHWLVKRAFGFAGRGRRRIAAGALDVAATTWLEASLRGGEGMQVEPWVERVRDYALHGFIAESGTVTLGEPTRQICDDAGAWKNTAVATDLDESEQRSLHASAGEVAEALTAAGYFGPFGIDAYRWRQGNRAQFNPRSEINARYSMGWAVGMVRCRADRT
jgi:hypothetical protein